MMHVFIFVLAAAVKVQKSNHHHWDQSSNYCHPPHASHSKTWSSPSHPHNQQDHCKCKLSLVTALLLAGPFFWLFNSPIIKTFLHDYPNNSHNLFTFLLHSTAVMIFFLYFPLIAVSALVLLCFVLAAVSAGFSPSSTATSGFSSQGSNTLPCPVAPTSPRSATGRRRNRKKDHKSSCMINYLLLYCN